MLSETLRVKGTYLPYKRLEDEDEKELLLAHQHCLFLLKLLQPLKPEYCPVIGDVLQIGENYSSCKREV